MQRFAGVPIAGDNVFGAIRRFYDRLDGVRELLTDGEITSARLVVNPERLVVAEARRTYTYLSLFGYHVDAVVANRILPPELDHPWLAQWRVTQQTHLDVIDAAFSPLPILPAELASEEVVGLSALSVFAKGLYGDTDAVARRANVPHFRIEPGRNGALLLSLHLPFTSRADVELGRVDDELVVTVGPHRRTIVLPDSLVRREVGGARFVEDRLVVEFV